MTNLRKLFDRARAASEERSYLHGLLGHPDGSTIAVADRPTYVYVRLARGGGESVTIARNVNAVPQRYDLPVRLRLEPGIGYVVVGYDTSYYDAATVDESNEYGFTYHTHKIGSGLEYEIEALRFEPGRAFPAGSWTVTVNPFRYYSDGAWQTYEGEDLDLLPNRPSTTGKHRWVVIAVDPGTNAATKTNGSDQDYATTLTQADLDAIDIGDDIPLVAVRIRADDTSLTISRFIDAGGWRNVGVGVSTLADLTDTNITTPAGNSILIYDNATSKWIDDPYPTIPENIEDLSDVSFTSLGDNHTMLYDLGTNTWENIAFLLTSLLDVNISGVSDGEVLTYDNATSKWVNAVTGAAGSVDQPITDWSYRNSNRSTSAYSWKGNRFTPDREVEIWAIAYYGTLVAGATYQAAVITGDASPGNVATASKSTAITLPGSLNSTNGGWLWLEFSTPVTLSAGTVYGLMVGRTDSTDTYALPTPFNGGATAENAVPIAGLSHGNYWRVADADLQVGSAIDAGTTDSHGAGYRFRYTDSSF